MCAKNLKGDFICLYTYLYINTIVTGFKIKEKGN